MIEIRLATTAAEREAVYRFRYRVYVEEMGRYRATADHTARRLVDPEDERGWIIYAHDGADVVGSYRSTWGPHGFSARQIEQYRLGPFLDELPARSLLVGERTMVAPAYRGTSVAADLANGSREPIDPGVVRVVFGACEPHLLSFHARLNTWPYASRNINSEEAGYLIPLVAFPCGADSLLDIGPRPGMPRCIQDALGARSAVTSAANIGERGYQEQLAPRLRALRTMPGSLFDGLTAEGAEACTARSSTISCRAGDRVVKRGGSAHNLFVVLGGRLEARDGERVVGTLLPGDVYGESAFLLHRPRSLDVVVVDPSTTILSLSERVVRQILDDRPEIATTLLLNISRALCERSEAGATSAPWTSVAAWTAQPAGGASSSTARISSP